MWIHVLLSFLGIAFLVPIISVFSFFLFGLVLQKNQWDPAPGPEIEMEPVLMNAMRPNWEARRISASSQLIDPGLANPD